MKIILPIVLAAFLSACGTTPAPPLVIQKTTYVAAQPNEEFLVDNKCPWPKKAAFVKNGTDLEVSDYLFAAYNAWTCEHNTRMAIKKQSAEMVKDVEARNAR